MSQPRIEQLLLWRLGLSFSLAVLALTVACGLLLHGQIHRRTDALLLQMAHRDADSVLREHDIGVHVHDGAVQLPALDHQATDRVALAYTHDGRVLAETSGLAVGVLPPAWREGLHTPGDHRLFDATLGGEPLRVAACAVVDPEGHLLLFAAAVSRHSIDQAVLRTIGAFTALAALLLLVVLGATSVQARRLTRDLHALSDACAELGEPSTASLGAWRRALERQPPPMTAETAALAQAMRSFVTGLEQVISLQSRFVAEAAHELRTPLTALQGELELGLRRERGAEEYREFLEAAYDDAQHLVQLSEQLLQAARVRVEELSLVSTHGAPLVEASLQRHRAALDEAGVSVEVLGEGGPLLADPVAVARVLDNLLRNVVEHSGAQRLTVTLGPQDIRVSDDGVGVPEDLRECLFVPFAKGGHHPDSHGLGLYICQRLMARQGGALELEEGGPGTTWRLRFQAPG